jgi:membrane fusion protein, macrolide-specific efflux system
MKNKIITLAGIVLAVILLSTCVKKTSSTVDTSVTAEIGTIKQMVSVSGTVLPKNRLEVKPPLSGRIERVYVTEGRYVSAGDTLALMSSSERAAMLDAARAQGQSNMAYWEKVYKPVLIVSPMNGTVIVVNVQPGQTINSGDATFVISDRLIVHAEIDETDIGGIKTGMPAVITLDAYPDAHIPAHVGAISYESTVVNNVTQYEADIIPDTVPDFVRSGMSASIDIIKLNKEKIVLLPTEAIRSGRNGSFVILPSTNANGKPVFQKIQTGISDDTKTEITSGLKDGDKVLITKNSYKLQTAGDQTTNPFLPKMGGRTTRSTTKK